MQNRIPDEPTILQFRHLLEKHNLTEKIMKTINRFLQEKGLMMQEGTIVDATLISAPSSTKADHRVNQKFLEVLSVLKCFFA